MERENLTPSRMSRWETAAALLWLPIHILLLPLALAWLRPGMRGVDLNFWVYAIGAAALTLLCARFLRQDFDPLWERPGRILLQIALGYGLILLAGELVGLLLYFFLPASNPNNAAVMALAAQDQGKIGAMSIFLAPLVAELMFRGGVFGLLRRRSRILAYGVSILLFSLYHTWQYALAEPLYWLYLLQYVPASYALCRCYEKTESIWTPMLLHMLNNGVSFWILTRTGV